MSTYRQMPNQGSAEPYGYQQAQPLAVVPDGAVLSVDDWRKMQTRVAGSPSQNYASQPAQQQYGGPAAAMASNYQTNGSTYPSEPYHGHQHSDQYPKVYERKLSNEFLAYSTGTAMPAPIQHSHINPTGPIPNGAAYHTPTEMRPQIVGAGTNVPRQEHVTKIDVSSYPGGSMGEQIRSAVAQHPVVLVSKSHCPFCLELKRTFAELGVPMHVMDTDKMSRGGDVLTGAKNLTKQKTVPMCWVKGEFLGGCDDVKALHHKGLLEDKVSDLMVTSKVNGAHSFETMRAVPPPRGQAMRAFFWFPATVNNWVVRMTGILVVVCCAVSMAYWNSPVGHWMAAFLLFDFVTRLVLGSYASILGMLATLFTLPLKPVFKAGPPKQFAALCGTTFSLVATCCYFTHHWIPGACVIGGLTGAAALEGFCDFCLGCWFYGLGIRFGLIPPYVYRIFTNSRQEAVDAWDYEHLPNAAARRPVPVDTDPSNKTALKYKKRTDEWTKDDFHPIRNMQVTYFAWPLALCGLATAFKLAAGILALDLDRTRVRIWWTWYQVLALIAVFFFCIFLVLYFVRLLVYPQKCIKEWHCPLRSPAFGTITLCMMLFAFLWWDTYPERNKPEKMSLLFDTDDFFDNESYEWLGRILFWMGAATHIMLTIAKMGEWIGRRLELEHVHATWMILPVGNIVAAMVAPVVPAFHDSVGGIDSFSALSRNMGVVFDSNAWANLELARFFYSVGFIMWVVLFTITFFKTATTHNSDDRVRHSTFIWVAAPALIAIVEYLLCSARNTVFSTPELVGECVSLLSFYFYFAIIIFLVLCWATLPYINFFMRDQFSIYYWFECFSIDTLAAAAAVYYSVYGTYFSLCLMIIFLVLAFAANVIALLHSLTKIFKRRTLFCPEYKWSPLSFMKLTHEAVRAAMPKLSKYLVDVDVSNLSTIQVFCASFAEFVTLHEEHSKHEDEVIFKTFDDFFVEHGKRFWDDHDHDRVMISQWKVQCNTLINMNLPLADRQAALSHLQTTIPPFLDHFLEHLQGEEDNQNPVGKRYIPLEISKQIVRKAWEITPAEKWEVIMPYLINNLPRTGQRVRLLKCFCWAMPERAQQIGAIVYRGCDSVKWETISFEIPEIIPRGAPNWRRYY